jgi:hypothetical protein
MEQFISLIQDFISNRITPKNFQDKYIALLRLQRDTNEVVTSDCHSEVIRITLSVQQPQICGSREGEKRKLSRGK